MKSYRRTRVRQGRGRSSRGRFRRAFLLGVVIVVCAAGIWFLNTESFRVSRIEVAGALSLPEKQIHNKADLLLRERYLYVIPYDNIFFIPRDALREAIKSISPKIQDVRLDLSGRDTLRILVVERAPFAMWCRGDNDCFFVDDEGISFERAPSEFGSYIVFTDEVAPSCIFGCSVVSATTIEFIQTARRVFQKEGVRIRSVHHYSDDDYTLRTDTDTDIRFSGSVSIIETLNNIFSLTESKVFERADFKENLGMLLTLDVRFGKKLYYTFKSE